MPIMYGRNTPQAIVNALAQQDAVTISGCSKRLPDAAKTPAPGSCMECLETAIVVKAGRNPASPPRTSAELLASAASCRCDDGCRLSSELSSSGSSGAACPSQACGPASRTCGQDS